MLGSHSSPAACSLALCFLPVLRSSGWRGWRGRCFSLRIFGDGHVFPWRLHFEADCSS